jgi:hypothetical protein
MLKLVKVINERFWGPVEDKHADRLTDIVLDSQDIRECLQQFASGFIDGNELSYRIQCLYEFEDEHTRKNRNDDGMERRKQEREEAI